MAATYTVGDGKTYSTIQAAVDAIPGNLSGQGVQTVEIYHGGVSVGGGTGSRYDESIDILTGFSNTGFADYIRVVGMVSHVGLRDYGIIIKGQAPGSGHLIVFETVAYTRLENLAITAVSGWAGGATIGVWVKGTNSQSIELFLYDLTPQAPNGAIGIYCHSVGNNHYLENCAAVNVLRSTIYYFNSGVNHKVYNCTAFGGADYGIIFNACTITVTNTIVGDSITKDFLLQAGANAVVTYCVSEDDSADDWGGAGNQINKVMADQFVSATVGSEDIHLKAGADCIDAGVDLSGTFTGDIDGDTRTGSWDVGADENVTGIDRHCAFDGFFIEGGDVTVCTDGLLEI
jgi:hypothetical protein